MTLDILLKYLHATNFQIFYKWFFWSFYIGISVYMYLYSFWKILVRIKFSEWHFDSLADRGVSKLHQWLVAS